MVQNPPKVVQYYVKKKPTKRERSLYRIPSSGREKAVDDDNDDDYYVPDRRAMFHLIHNRANRTV